MQIFDNQIIADYLVLEKRIFKHSFQFSISLIHHIEEDMDLYLEIKGCFLPSLVVPSGSGGDEQ